MNELRIEFSGEVSRKSITEKHKRQIRNLFFIMLMITLGSALFSLLFWKIENDLWFILFSRFTLFALYIILMLPLILVYKNFSVKQLSHNIVIDSYGITVETSFKNKKYNYRTPLSKIKKVIDYGDYYMLRTSVWIAQKFEHVYFEKQNIKQGTTDEFEKLFVGKIKRKVKNKTKN